MRVDVLGAQPGVEIDGAGAQTRTLCDPIRGVVLELDLAAVGVRPLASDHLASISDSARSASDLRS
jgi:hypothetical protein